ncbi:GNAT family N-acetyltransferase [Micromonospora radicis]|uniref:GNAT family N-acetyltransferase n=1 Tax=Micromonospora radicis TaxID=1894971 RepID=A0A418MNX6_9ACTN|nr:GNAT family N-acetyltransferase [Micromonospora radicis]RIV33167.1 GNAT family N-acetyltransferase [Micromonospora radicis]
MLREQDVGHRIVVRRVVGVRAGRPVYSDALGELVELTETHLTLTTRQGPLRVPMAQVHRAKRVPPTRRPAADAVVDLELAAAQAWPAPTQARLGDWLLRAADGWTGRANSALPVGDPDRPLPAALDAVERWYAERNLRAMVNTPLPLAAPVGAELDLRGWGSRPTVLVQTTPLAVLAASAAAARRHPSPPPATARPATPPHATARPATPPHATARPAPPDATARPAPPDAAPTVLVELAGLPSEEWLAVASGRKGGLPNAARHVLTAVDQVRFAHAYADGTLVGIGRGSVTGQGRWLGLSLIEVLPSARGRGYATAVVHALASWAETVGATDAFLQVEQRNAAAVSLYRKLGFTTHHTYRTRVAPD